MKFPSLFVMMSRIRMFRGRMSPAGLTSFVIGSADATPTSRRPSRADVLDAVAAGTVGLPGWLVDEQFVIAPEFERGPLTAEEESAFDRYLASQDRSASEE